VRGGVATPVVISVSRDATHRFSKVVEPTITLVRGLGVAGDAHFGATVQHRSRVRRDPTQPNLRQVHLIHAELLDEFAAAGHRIAPGEMGENITTRGVDLLALPTGARLAIGQTLIEVTGLRNPCRQISDRWPGLMPLVLHKTGGGDVVRRAGVMGVVVTGGDVHIGDEIAVIAPEGPARPLAPV
jgi:MOSC domain-containing protein YiiM